MSASGQRLDPTLVQAALEEKAPQVLEDAGALVADVDGKLKESDVPERLTAPEIAASIGAAVDPKADRAALPVNLLDYATPGTTDQTANIQAAIDATPDGGTLEVPAGAQFKLNGQVTINKSLTVFSSGRGGFYSTSVLAQRALYVTANNVKLRGLKIVGPAPAAAVAQYGVSGEGVSGVFPILGFEVYDCEVSGWGHTNIRVLYGGAGTRVAQNVMTSVPYAGIRLASCVGFVCAQNQVSGGYMATGYVNCYGITMDRANELSDVSTAEPRSGQGACSLNVVRDFPTWAGIDTHGGQGIAITGNTVTNCKFPISCVSAKNAANQLVYAPLDIGVVDNIVTSTVADGSYNSVHLIGNATQRASGVIKGNVIRGHGYQTSSTSGGLQLEYTVGVIVTGNTLIECSPMGILINGFNSGFVCVGNTVIDPWSSTTLAKVVVVSGTDNTGHVSRNVGISTGAKDAATYHLSNGLGVSIANSANNAVQIGDNTLSGAGTPINDPGAKAKSALGAVPNITGSKGANAALTSLLSALATKGLLTDATT